MLAWATKPHEQRTCTRFFDSPPTSLPLPSTLNPLAAAQHGGSANHHHPSDHHPTTSNAPAGFYISSFDEATGTRNDGDDNHVNGGDLNDAAAGSRSDGGGPPFDRQEDFETSEASLGYGGGAGAKIGEIHQAAIPDLLSAAEKGESGL